MGLTLADPESAQLSLDLTELEQNTLDVCEEVIERNLKGFMETGDALATIRDGRLYRATDATFEAYCRRKWNISRPYAYELMDAAKIAGQMSGIPDIPTPANPAQAIALKSVPEEDRAEVWQEAVSTAPEGKVTAGHVEAVVKARTEPETPCQTNEPTQAVDHDTMTALFRSFSPEIFLGRIQPPVLIDGRLYVSTQQTPHFDMDRIERASAPCFRVVEMDWWIDQLNPVYHADAWKQFVEDGDKHVSDVRGLRVVASNVPAGQTCYYVLTGERKTFTFQAGKQEKAVLQNPGKIANEPDAIAEKDNSAPEGDTPKPEPEIGTSEEPADGAGVLKDALPVMCEPDAPIVLRSEMEPRVRGALKTLGVRMTEAYGKSGVNLSKAELKLLTGEIQRLQTIEQAYRAVQTGDVDELQNAVDFWKQASNDAWEEQKKTKEELEQMQATLSALPHDGIVVAGNDFELLVRLAGRKRPGQETEDTPQEYLSMIIQQRAAAAGISVETEK